MSTKLIKTQRLNEHYILEVNDKKPYFKVNDIKIHWGFIFLPKSFRAITLFGRVFTNLSKNELYEYLLTPRGIKTINHERIHILQAQSFRFKYLSFYAYYLYYWIIGLFKYGTKDNKSYYKIPFEKEAYYNENNNQYLTTYWKSYLD